jgi:hypothetical protein
MALKLKAKQEKCTYTRVKNLQAYSLHEKRGISAFVHNCRRNIKNVVVIRRPLTAVRLKTVLRPDLDPGCLPNPDPDSYGLVCYLLGISHCNDRVS